MRCKVNVSNIGNVWRIYGNGDCSGWYENNCGLPYAGMECAHLSPLYSVCESLSRDVLHACERTPFTIYYLCLLHIKQQETTETVSAVHFLAAKLSRKWKNQIAKSMHYKLATNAEWKKIRTREHSSDDFNAQSTVQFTVQINCHMKCA